MLKPAPKDSTFAAAMKSLRMRSGKTLSEIAPDVGVSAQAMSRWENATASFPSERVIPFLKAIGATEADVEKEIAHLTDPSSILAPAREGKWWHEFPDDLEKHVVGDEVMSPWVEPGESVWVHRDRHPRRMEGCLIEFKDGTTKIRLYERGKDGFYFFKRLDTDMSEQVLHSDVAGIHRIAFRGH
ncbi:helix-turn-helix domain-containing protein [Asticcacaulis endophyticus]|nr:helix-turn-helix transcriptional regulator [Asticcacaulis endophyticus]